MFELSNEELFTKALQLEEPWYIEKVEFKNEELHMYVAFKKGFKFKNKENEEITAYDTISKTWRHLNFFQYKAYIHCDVARIKSSTGINMIDVPWSRAGSGFTMLFESFILELSKIMSVKAISRIVKEYDTRIWRILGYYVNKAREVEEYCDVNKLGIDETSVSGHNYITIGVDLDKSRVISITEGKDTTTVDRIAKEIEEHKCKRENIKIVTSDMSPAFSIGIRRNFENAINVYDKFHVMKAINEALDKTRKRESSKNEILKNSKYLFLKNRNKLNQEQEEKLEKLLKSEYLETSIVYQYKLQFQDIYNSLITKEEAKQRIIIWMKEASTTKIKELKKLSKMIGMKIENILNYFENRITNATLEGINSIIQLAKTRARGFKNIENFKTIIYLISGKLNLCINET